MTRRRPPKIPRGGRGRRPRPAAGEHCAMDSWKRISKEAEAAWHAFLRGGSPQTAPSWLRPFALTGLSVALTAVLFAIGDLTSPRDLGRLLIALAWLLAGVNGLFAAYALV